MPRFRHLTAVCVILDHSKISLDSSSFSSCPFHHSSCALLHDASRNQRCAAFKNILNSYFKPHFLISLLSVHPYIERLRLYWRLTPQEKSAHVKQYRELIMTVWEACSR